MLDRLKQHITEHLGFLEGRNLLIACSGGLDSVCLARSLHTLGYRIGLAHCDFGLRGKESDVDAEFVEELSKMLSVPFYLERFQTESYAKKQKLSVQMAARELRYSWFEEIRNDFDYDYVLTAHHADDNLETFLINLSRGSGIRGLSGIPTVFNHVVRPLLVFNRKEILEFAKEQGYFWREDSSNTKTDYLRNALRLEVIPHMKDHMKGLLEQLANTQGHLRESEALVEDYMTLIRQLVVTETESGLELNITKLKELPNHTALLYEILHPFGFTAWEDVAALLEAQSGKKVVSSTHRVLKDRDTLLLTELPVEMDDEVFEIDERLARIEEPVPIIFSEVSALGEGSNTEIFVDATKLAYPLRLRKWKEGDYFYPFGMKGKKKLSKYFKDEKLSLVAKEKIWLLCSGDDIVWIVGHRADDRFKVEPESKKILRIHTSKSTG